MANRPRRNNPNSSGNNAPAPTTPEQGPLSEYDTKILAAPTPLDLALLPGSETTSFAAEAAYNDVQASLDTTIDLLKQQYPTPVGDKYVSPGGPGIDMLNLMALMAHRKRNENGNYTPAQDPSATMAQNIICAYPNPKQLIADVSTHAKAMLERSRHQGDTFDPAGLQESFARLLPIVYGPRYQEYRDQHRAERLATAVTAAEQAAAAAREQQARDEEESLKYTGREILANSKSATLNRTQLMNQSLMSLQMRHATARNALSGPKHALLQWNKNRAEAKYLRKQAKVGSSMFKFINNHRARVATKAKRTLDARSGILNAHQAMMDGRVKTVEAQAAVRERAYKEKIKLYSEQKIAAEESRIQRRALRQRELHARSQGMNKHESKLYAARLSPEDKRRIRLTAVRAAKRNAIRQGYNPGTDYDRDN